uniref:Putative vesicle-associated membrane protein-associated protein n=1 Tax=Corethrella appendiculata TaxID=1370023 RepID=U5EXC9_9DIPT
MATKQPQLLVIEPLNELKFWGPFNTSVSSHMRLTNPTDYEILFKIKTTAPKKYCVRPNCGTLEPKSTIEITIILQPFIFDPNEKNKHKFMVQSMIKPEGDFTVEQLWKEVSPDQLMDSKLRCVFELPVDNNQGLTQQIISQATTALISNESTIASDCVPFGASGANLDDDKPDPALYNAALREVKQLRESESALRQQILQLKEQLLRTRLTAEADAKEQQTSLSSGISSSSSLQYQNPYSPPQLANQQIPMVYVAIAIAMAVFGLILGKFVL